MKLFGTQVCHYDGTIVTKIRINIFNKKKVIEVLTFEQGSGGVPPRIVEGLVYILIPPPPLQKKIV
jgi:hypothetical protein